MKRQQKKGHPIRKLKTKLFTKTQENLDHTL